MASYCIMVFVAFPITSIRFNKYTDLEAKQRFADGQNFSFANLVLSPADYDLPIRC